MSQSLTDLTSWPQKYCYVSGIITAKHSAQIDILNKEIIAKCEENDFLFDCGSKTSFLDFQTCGSFNKDKNRLNLTITFDVLWAFTAQDMRKLIEWMGKFVPIEDLTAEFYFENQGYHFGGEYELKNGILRAYLLNKTNFRYCAETKPQEDINPLRIRQKLVGLTKEDADVIWVYENNELE